MIVRYFFAFLVLLFSCSSLAATGLDSPPIAVCYSSINVSLSTAGDVTLQPEWLDAGSTDDTGIASLTLNEDYFTCADIGSHTVILTVEDLDGNTAICWSTVNIEDKLSPVLICNASIFVSVGADGTLDLTPSMLDAGSFDNCNVNLSIPPTTVTCSDVGGNFNLLLTGSDDSGNTNSCFTNVSVEDQMAPTARCKDSVRALSKSGRYKPNINHVDDGSFDNCGIALMSVDPPILFCSDLGPNDVTLFVQD
ncbi:MAG: hypothetical protein KDC44_07605, partial [Phaeodactylibacter sp.]|nr:hypothetical protein [Phaeodactylibacter sp.]